MGNKFRKLAFRISLNYNVSFTNQQRNWANVINPYIVLGGIPITKSLPIITKNEALKEITIDKLLPKFSIRRVLTILDSFEYEYLPKTDEEWQEYGISDRLWVPCKDFNGVPSEEDFRKAMKFLTESKELKQNTYVHCKAGRGRSVLLVICHLIQEENMSYSEAFSFVKSKRPHILISENQFKFIMNFVKEINGP